MSPIDFKDNIQINEIFNNDIIYNDYCSNNIIEYSTITITYNNEYDDDYINTTTISLLG
jgi:hypothetical protein